MCSKSDGINFQSSITIRLVIIIHSDGSCQFLCPPGLKKHPRLMFAPDFGLAVPRKTPQPVVCGQFPSSQSPSIGKTIDVKAMISGSSVNMVAHFFLTSIAKANAESPMTELEERPTIAASFALFGLLAPSSFPTLVDTPKLKEDGKMYIKDVV
ncbi:hypothetical protein QQP08_009904 [Theobroma cacao]|nr:hypothetical protein QQP08_009904 [Theobroma cacao]